MARTNSLDVAVGWGAHVGMAYPRLAPSTLSVVLARLTTKARPVVLSTVTCTGRA